ncbi:MAG: S8 family serine peptidase [Flavobacteriaceae bacterium]|nr:S8 family serine peptidase [Flavobacteriaceae bacterium]
MRILKPILVTAVAGLLITGCKSIANIPVPPALDNAVNTVAKKASLTEDEKNNWQHLDLEKDTIPGMSVNKAYEFLKGKKGKVVIVGVIDSGTDLAHEDLKDVAWVNEDEIPNNKIDDDKNGFVDDIYGWNFLGDIYKENYESARILANPSIASEEDYKKAKEEQEQKIKTAKTNKGRYEQILAAVNFANDNISKHFGDKKYTKEDVLAIKSEDQNLTRSVQIAQQMYGFGLPSLADAKKELTTLIEDANTLIENKPITDYRKVLNNDANTMEVTIYGNNKTGHSVKDEAHGSHVSGIIAATRNNNKGMNGVADNVRLMAVRAVPDGDEYDKDVALAIRYAVDNGAKVINTSFGKAYSPKKQWVYDAIKYAASKDVLIVNAAGNDGKNIDIEKTFPNDSQDLVNEIADNVLTIGAMSANYSETLPASFSNYGKKNVDIFAPGVQVYSTTPENEYKKFNGTSMAAPATAGVAALIRSYYPKLTASQVKHIIMNSGTKINLEVIKPGTKDEKVKFEELSVSGRVVNAYNALKMADNMINR